MKLTETCSISNNLATRNGHESAGRIGLVDHIPQPAIGSVIELPFLSIVHDLFPRSTYPQSSMNSTPEQKRSTTWKRNTPPSACRGLTSHPKSLSPVARADHSFATTLSRALARARPESAVCRCAEAQELPPPDFPSG